MGTSEVRFCDKPTESFFVQVNFLLYYILYHLKLLLIFSLTKAKI